MKCFIGIDIGGSHITTGIINSETNTVSKNSISSSVISSALTFKDFINLIEKNIRKTIQPNQLIQGIGFAFPGPFIYEKGICSMEGVNKFDQLFGCDLRTSLFNLFKNKYSLDYEAIKFINDAQAFLLGAIVTEKLENKNVIGVTLGTGIGSAFSEKGNIVENANNIPPNGYLYNVAFKDGIAEDCISTRWFLKNYPAKSVNEIAKEADKGDKKAVILFQTFGKHLAEILIPWIKSFNADTIVFGGGILNAWHLIKESFLNKLHQQNIQIEIIINTNTEEMNMIGAVKNIQGKMQRSKHQRKTEQILLPKKKPGVDALAYNIYPTQKLLKGSIHNHLTDLVSFLPNEGNIIIDGFGGVFWDKFIEDLSCSFAEKNIIPNWYCIDAALKSSDEIDKLIGPFLNSDGVKSIFGKCYDGMLKEFFDDQKLAKIKPDDKGINILYGTGAALAKWNGTLVYVDITKNEIQFRSKAGSFKNLGAAKIENAKAQYKRCYFIDWKVLNKHKQQLLLKIDFIIDGQQTQFYPFTTADAFRETLKHLSNHTFRARPWFEPGIWGGQWIKKNIPLLAQDVPNYAWSFELITPENGLLFEDKGLMLEVSFDWLMFAQAKNILGKAYKKFGTYFPIRFDYLDTMDGDNLSIQCHPSLNYIKENFGEMITQDETYYILDCAPGAKVYLGFQENINADEFKNILLQSQQTSVKLPIENYVQKHDAYKHDLFLIPNKTIHGSGKNNMVLEISNTPYIFTFKLYDWVRLDLDGNPRPINIEHGMKNLDFSRKGNSVKEKLISKPILLKEGNNFSHWHLPTHPQHIYDIERYEWYGTIFIETKGQCHILMLVEGSQISIKANGQERIYNYAETIVVPAAIKKYSITYLGKEKGILVKAFIKDSFCKL
ncbi:MAG TPA: ROK family protein [Hanamia sp.]|nr:ROK family protein [Hanamia sp.]